MTAGVIFLVAVLCIWIGWTGRGKTLWERLTTPNG